MTVLTEVNAVRGSFLQEMQKDVRADTGVVSIWIRDGAGEDELTLMDAY
jgi:hypothetical protein